MQLLLQSKKNVEDYFGKKGTMATNLLDMVAQGEKAFGWLLGAMDNGFDLTVGFFDDKARYVAFKKRAGTRWTQSDVRVCLMVIGDMSNWTWPANSEFFDYRERQGGQPNGPIIASATGWHTPRRRYAFMYVPIVPGEIALVPARDSIDKNFPT
jgi:hypothetical protein